MSEGSPGSRHSYVTQYIFFEFGTVLDWILSLVTEKVSIPHQERLRGHSKNKSCPRKGGSQPFGCESDSHLVPLQLAREGKTCKVRS